MNIREWALPVYTILIQLTVGAITVLWILRQLTYSKFNHEDMEKITRNPILVIVFTVFVAMIGAHFHLSKPFLSFYASRNFMHSWLSREIVFTMLFFLATLSILFLDRYYKERRALITRAGWIAIGFGITLVYCMARIYMLPTQVAWNSPWVVVSFFATTILLGTMTIISLLVLDLNFSELQKSADIGIREQIIKHSLGWMILVVVIGVIISLLVNIFQVMELSQGDQISRTSLQLLLELYAPLLVLRVVTVIAAPVWLGYAAFQMYKKYAALEKLLLPVYISCLMILVGEIIGRFLFYATHIRVGI